MSPPWIDVAGLVDSLQTQARNIADRLGHRMTYWVALPEERTIYMARCVDCREAATVAARHFSLAPISGVAVSLRCGPLKKR